MHDHDDILTLKEVAERLKLDVRSVGLVAYDLGGKRIGKSWRFKWGTVLKFFDVNFEGQGQPMDGPRGGAWQADYGLSVRRCRAKESV